jgi:hypothetical protein
MMLFLSRNVLPYLFNMRLADAKCCVSSLPSKIPMIGPSPLHPFGRIGFYFLHKICKRQDRRLNQEHMNMIFNTVYQQRVAAEPINRAAQIGKQLSPYFGIDPRAPILGTEQRMNHDVRVCVSHVIYVAPDGACAHRSVRNPTAYAVGHKITPLRGFTSRVAQILVSQKLCGFSPRYRRSRRLPGGWKSLLLPRQASGSFPAQTHPPGPTPDLATAELIRSLAPRRCSSDKVSGSERVAASRRTAWALLKSPG